VLAAWYDRQGPAAEVLQVGEMAALEPGPGEVRARMNLSGVNPGDTKKRGDWVGYGMPHPRIIPHSDGSGVLDAVGDNVNSSRVGRRVWVQGPSHTFRSARRRSSPLCPPSRPSSSVTR
jgi:NADPH2:quinone reductase